MIRVSEDGRRKSERTRAEDEAAVAEAMAHLAKNGRALFQALLDESDPAKADQLTRELEAGLYHTPPVSMQQFLEDPYYLGESTTTLYPELRGVLLDMFAAPYREVLLAGSIGYGKCVDGDTELYDPVAGCRVTVREASLGNLGAVAWDGASGVPSAAKAAQSGWKPLGWLTMRSGVRVRMSADHPVMTADGFVPVARLVPGDLVASLRRTPPPVRPLDVGDAEVIWVAYMLADGGSTQPSMTFTNMNPVLHEEFDAVTSALGVDDPMIDAASGCRFVRYDGKARTVCPHGMQWLRRKYNMTRPSRTKRVPAYFYGLSDRQLGLFLNRVWACDGWVSRHLQGWEVGICLASEAFIRDIQQLLLRFGIRARMRPRTMHYQHKGERRERPAWSLEMHDCASVRRFLNAVGDVRGKEEACRSAREDLRSVVGNPNVDVTPMDGAARGRLRRELGPFPRGTWWGGRPKHQRLGNDAMRRLGAEVHLPSWCSWWADVFWDEVVSYEPGVVAEPVFDVEVPAHANFTPQGMIVHNTYLASIAFCRILYELSCLRHPQAAFGVGPGTEMVMMLISKSLPLCREVLKTAVDDKIKLSPYFMGKFPPKFSTDFTLFPNNIRMTVGSYGAERALGKAVVAAICDECLGKNSLLRVRDNDTFVDHTVGSLWGMTEAERDGLRVEALDHATGQRVWTSFGMRESTVQPLVRIEAANTCSLFAIEPSLEHPVLVRRGDWLVYVPAGEVRVGDETVWRVGDGEEGRTFVRGDEVQAVGFEAGELYAGVALADVGADEATYRGRPSAPALTGDEGRRPSEVRAVAIAGDACEDERGATEAGAHGAHRRGTAADLRGERASDSGSGADVPVSCVVAVWEDGSVPFFARGIFGAAPVRDAGGVERGGRGPDGTNPVHAAGAEALDGGRLSGDAERWGARDRGGQIADELLQGAGSGAYRGAMALDRGSEDATDHRVELEAPAERVAGSVCDGGIHGGSAEQASALSHYADGRAIGGCRFECLPVADLPPEFCLARVKSARVLPPEQTYSVETACQTFVADGCVVHNTNFPPKRNAQQIQQTLGRELTAAHFDIVEKVYRSLVRRIKSRFERVSGDVPGMVFLASSAATLDSFTERKLRESVVDPDVFVVEHSQWSAKPQDFFSGEVFYVLCSRSSLRSRIMEAAEAELLDDKWLEEHDAWMVEVPVEYRDDFETNLEDSLRDLAGVSTQAISAFFQRTEAIDACINPRREHPFSDTVWVAGSPGSFRWDVLCRRHTRRLPGGFMEEAWSPREAPTAPRWVHIDVGVTRDYAGFCLGRIERWVEVVRRDGDGNRYADVAPSYVAEVLLSIRPPPGEQIYMPDLRRLVYELQAHGFPIAGFSTDTYEHVEMHQQVRRHGIHTEIISMDTSVDPYEELKSAIYERRIEFYGHEMLLKELRSLEYDRLKGKIDHPRYCFTGETRIALADGTCPTFKELSQRTDPFYVYAIGPDGVCIAPAEDAHVTMVAEELVEVTLDNYQVVRCTPDHLFMTLDREWVQAQHLTPDVRLMPLYRVKAAKGGTVDYERVWCPIRRERFLTHRLAVGLPPVGTVVHHIDGDKTNNDLCNLAVMERGEHYKYHGDALWERRREVLREGHRRYVEDQGRRISSDTMRRTWEEGKFGPPRGICAIEGCGQVSNARGLCDVHYQRAKRRGALPERMERARKINHRVLRVDRVVAREAVYDLSVPGLQNFALAAGVFVHNSSKDLSDALAGVVWGLKGRAARLPWSADADTSRVVVGHEDQWVSPLIPADQVDMEEVRDAQRSQQPGDVIPAILFGSED